MGKKSRRVKVNPNRPARTVIMPVARPFEAMAAEVELVAMRELVPAATLTAQTTAEYGQRDFLFVTILPAAAQAMVRRDGTVLVALQTRSHSGDAGHDLGVALKAGLERAEQVEAGRAEPGAVAVDVRSAGPRINEMVASTGKLEVAEDLSFWIDPAEADSPHIREAIEQSAKELIKTVAIPGVRGTFWHEMSHNFVRWIRAEDESALLTALARLQLRGELTLGHDSRVIGAFRTCGLLVPVFEFPEDVDPTCLTEPVQQLEQKLVHDLADTSPVDDDVRRVRAGLVSRQVSLR